MAVRIVIRGIAPSSLSLIGSLSPPDSLTHWGLFYFVLSFSYSLSVSVCDWLCGVKQPQRCLTPSGTAKGTASVMLLFSNYLPH